MDQGTKKRIQGIMGLLVLLVAIGGLWFWEVYGRAAVLSDEIVVLNQDVNLRDPITEDMILRVKRPRKSLSIRETFNLKESQLIYEEEQIINLVAAHYIPEGQPLVKQYFMKGNLVPVDGQYTFNIPREWIMAIPGSLRRGDEITLYPFLKDKEKLIEELMATQENKEKNEQEEMNLLEGDILMVDQDSLRELLKDFEKDLDTFTFVATHIKDGSNKEVVSVDLLDPEDKRFDASANIREVEVFATKDEVDQMDKLIQKGYVFIVMYRQ